jgi:hypothetical protein
MSTKKENNNVIKKQLSQLNVDENKKKKKEKIASHKKDNRGLCFKSLLLPALIYIIYVNLDCEKNKLLRIFLLKGFKKFNKSNVTFIIQRKKERKKIF